MRALKWRDRRIPSQFCVVFNLNFSELIKSLHTDSDSANASLDAVNLDMNLKSHEDAPNTGFEPQ